MPSIDCVDEIEIAAPAEQVFRTVLNYPEWQNWIPIYKCSLLNGDKIDAGSKIHHQYGYNPLILSNFIRSIESITPNKRIEEAYIDGDLLGKGIWQFTENNGATTASFHCMVTSNKVFPHISFFLMGKSAHRNVYKPLLKKLKAHCESL